MSNYGTEELLFFASVPLRLSYDPNMCECSLSAELGAHVIMKPNLK